MIHTCKCGGKIRPSGSLWRRRHPNEPEFSPIYPNSVKVAALFFCDRCRKEYKQRTRLPAGFDKE